MIVEKQMFNDIDGSLGWVECVYDSSNILSSVYFPKTKTLYLSFNRGITYKYLNIDEEIYEGLENSESQGKYFINEIKKKEFPYSKEYKLYESEIKDLKQKIEEWKKTNKSNQQ